MKNFLYAIFFLPSFLSAQSISDHPRLREAINLLELWLDAQQAYEEIPGISAGVVYDQELIWSKGFGYADLENRVPATPQTIYSICSISKLFTSIGVMQLRDEGKLDLDDPVSEHIPWLRIKQLYPEGPPATIQGLLTHSAGLPRETGQPYWSAPDFDFPTRDKILEEIGDQEMLYPSYSTFQYSNLGMTRAGELIIQHTDQSYEDYVTTHIMEPLKLANTRPELPEAMWGNELATGYSAIRRTGDREKVPFFQARGIAPAAGYSSTVEDLAKFASWQFRLLESNEEEILNPNTLLEMYRVHWLEPDWSVAWGLGFTVWKGEDKRFVGHGGSCPGYRTHLLIQPEKKISTIFLSNAMGVSPNFHTGKIYEIIAPAIEKAKKAMESEEAAEQKEDHPEWKKYCGIYDAWPWGGETAVVMWEGELALLSLPSQDPLEGLVKLKHDEGHVFRRIRKDKELGETLRFEVDASGAVTKMWWNSNFRKKLR
jgi:CubicO group peptidase (beta-lactamase class C family)